MAAARGTCEVKPQLAAPVERRRSRRHPWSVAIASGALFNMAGEGGGSRSRWGCSTGVGAAHHSGLAASASGCPGSGGGRFARNPPGLTDSDQGIPFQQALRVVDSATSFNERALRSAIIVLEHPRCGQAESEAVLSRLCAWLAPPTPSQAQAFCVAAGLPGCVVRALRRFRGEPPIAALACVAAVRSAGVPEGLVAYMRAGAMDELAGLMDRHRAHGGVQNVSLLLLCGLSKDGSAARQAVSLGFVQRIFRAMESTIGGREVQFNGLSALRLLMDGGRGPRAGLAEAAMRAKVAHQHDVPLCNVANDVLAMVTPRFKEVLCWHWRSGWCKLGPRCTYAHGPSDLRGGLS